MPPFLVYLVFGIWYLVFGIWYCILIEEIACLGGHNTWDSIWLVAAETKCLFLVALLTTGPPTTYPYFGPLMRLNFPSRPIRRPSLTLRSPNQTKPKPSPGLNVSLHWSQRSQFLVFACFVRAQQRSSFILCLCPFHQRDKRTWENQSAKPSSHPAKSCLAVPSAPFQAHPGSFLHFSHACHRQCRATW